MNTALIIPMRNQIKNLMRIVDGIEKQTVQPSAVIIILDRESQENIEKTRKITTSPMLKNNYNVFACDVIPEYIGNPAESDDEQFLAGDRRNRAINFAMSMGCDHYIFIDGDCVPQKDLVKSHRETALSGLPVLTCGRRREEKHGNKDQRELDEGILDKTLFKSKSGRIIYHHELLVSSSIVWSCNISMNLATVKLLSYLNKCMYGRYEVFCSEFSGKWGGEDTFIGIQAYLLNVNINMISDKFSGVFHIEHPRPVEKYNPDTYTKFLVDRINQLEEYNHRNPINMKFLTEALQS